MLQEYVRETDLLIHLESGQYPIKLEELIYRHPNVSLGQSVPLETIEHLGYKRVKPTDRPINDVVYETIPVERNGEFFQTWFERSHNPQEILDLLKRKKKKHIDDLKERLESKLKSGFSFTLDGAEYKLQATYVDLANLGMILLLAKNHVSEGKDVDMYLRTTSNDNLKVKPQELIDIVESVFSKHQEAMSKFYELEDEFKLAEKEEDFPDITNVDF